MIVDDDDDVDYSDDDECNPLYYSSANKNPKHKNV